MELLIERCRKLLWYMSEHEVAEYFNSPQLKALGDVYSVEEVFFAVKAAVILNGGKVIERILTGDNSYAR